MSSPFSGKWVVNKKGNWGRPSFEITVLRDDNTHGKISYGWIGENKILISHDGGPRQWPIPKTVWDKLIKVAQEVADELNAQEMRTEEKPRTGF